MTEPIECIGGPRAGAKVEVPETMDVGQHLVLSGCRYTLRTCQQHGRDGRPYWRDVLVAETGDAACVEAGGAPARSRAD